MNLSTEARLSLFDLVVHAVWADGRLGADELSVARAAARLLHPEGEDGARGKLALGPEVPLPDVARALTGRESAIGFAVALWVVLADGVERPREREMLDRFRLLAGLPRDIASCMRRLVKRTRAAVPAPAWEDQLRMLLREATGTLMLRTM